MSPVRISTPIAHCLEHCAANVQAIAHCLEHCAANLQVSVQINSSYLCLWDVLPMELALGHMSQIYVTGIEAK